MNAQHTYLLQPAQWDALGKWYDKNGEGVGLEGTTTITHGDAMWEHRGSLKLLRPVPVEFENVYEIIPFKTNAPSQKNSTKDFAKSSLTKEIQEVGNLFNAVADSYDSQTEWTSVNRSIGRLTGRYALIKESILSIAKSESGYHKTFEYLRKVNKSVYHSRGAVFVGENMVSSWAMVLRRLQ